jgi:hypothetical protein
MGRSGYAAYAEEMPKMAKTRVICRHKILKEFNPISCLYIFICGAKEYATTGSKNYGLIPPDGIS